MRTIPNTRTNPSQEKESRITVDKIALKLQFNYGFALGIVLAAVINFTIFLVVIAFFNN